MPDIQQKPKGETLEIKIVELSGIRWGTTSEKKFEGETPGGVGNRPGVKRKKVARDIGEGRG